MWLRKPLAVVVLIFFVIGSMLPSSNFLTLEPIPKAHAVSHSMKLTGAFSSGWNGTNPGPTITVARGDSVSLTLISGDSAPHTFIIDVDKDGVNSPNCSVDKCSQTFTATLVYTFTVDFGSGTYTYYCSIHLSSMVGSFIVPGPDYAVSSSPSSLTILQGAKTNSTVSITSLSNFAGSVTLSSSPSSPPGLMTSTFSPNPVTVPADGTAKSNFTISVAAATSPSSYSFTVTGSNATTSRNTSLSVTVIAPDFSIVSVPSSLTVNQGASGSSIINVTAADGFTGTVRLTASVSPAGLTVSLSPQSVTLSTTITTATSTLTITASNSGAYSTPVSPGGYNITLTGTMGSFSHSKIIPLTVINPTSDVYPGGPLVIGGIVAAVAVVAIAVYVLRRRLKK